jgi:hypothetical protein
VGLYFLKFEYLPFFSRTHVPSRISYRPPYHAHAHVFFIFVYFVNECVLFMNVSASQSQTQPLFALRRELRMGGWIPFFEGKKPPTRSLWLQAPANDFSPLEQTAT